MQKEKKKMLEVLKFYADDKNYRQVPCGYELTSNIEIDKGREARDIIKKIENR